MHVLFLVGLLVAFGFFVFWCFKHRSPVDIRETIIAFTGGLGSGKTADAVHYGRRIYRRNVLFCRRHRLEKPAFYSNIPVRIGFKEKCRILNNDITLLRTSIPEYSVVLIDEIGSYCSQFDYKVKNADRFDEFVRFFRHYINGTLICTDQCSENIVLQVRRRINTVHNLQKFRKWPFLPFCTVDMREITTSEEIKSIVNKTDEDDFSDGFRRTWFLGNPFKFYDSRCYSVRYAPLPRDNQGHFNDLKTERIFTIEK